MHAIRRYASLVATLVFLTSGPLGAWHVARESVAPRPCHSVAPQAAIADAHDLESAPEGTGCLACHLLQHARGPVSAIVTHGDDTAREARHLSRRQPPHALALDGLLPARAPPPALS